MTKEYIQDDGQLRVFIVPVDILDVPGLTSSEKLVYIVLRSYVNPTDPTAFPAYQTIASKASLSRRRVIDIIKSLEEKGLILKEARYTVTKERKIRDASNTYTLITPKRAKASAIISPPPVKPFHPGGETIAPNHNHLTNSLRNMIDCSGEIAAASESISEPNPVYETLQIQAPHMMIDNGRSLKQEPQYIAAIFLMLLNQFSNQLDPDVTKRACEFFSERTYDWVKCQMRIQVENPIGFFNTCYKDAVKEYKAKRSHHV